MAKVKEVEGEPVTARTVSGVDASASDGSTDGVAGTVCCVLPHYFFATLGIQARWQGKRRV